MTSGMLGESSKWNFGVGLGPLLSASQVLMSSRSAAARSMPRMPMAAVLWEPQQTAGKADSVRVGASQYRERGTGSLSLQRNRDPKERPEGNRECGVPLEPTAGKNSHSAAALPNPTQRSTGRAQLLQGALPLLPLRAETGC